MTIDNGGEAGAIGANADAAVAAGPGVTMPPQTESPVAPEAARQSNNLALQMRLALGGAALDKNKTDIPEVTEVDLVREHDANKDDLLKKMSVASTVESLRTWANLETAFQQNGDTRLSTHEGKLDIWKQDIIKKFQLPPNQAVITELRTVKIGAGSDALDFSNMDDATAQKLYDRYFKNAAGENNVVVLTGVPEPKKIPANIKRFIDDIHAAHQDPSGSVDYTAIKTHLHSISWLAKIFGPISADIITEYLESEINYHTDRQEFITEANAEINGVRRVNALNDGEKGLLNFIQVSNSRATYESTAATPAPPIIPTPTPLSGARPAVVPTPDAPFTLTAAEPLLTQITKELKRKKSLSLEFDGPLAERFIAEVSAKSLETAIKGFNGKISSAKLHSVSVQLFENSCLNLKIKIDLSAGVPLGNLGLNFVVEEEPSGQIKVHESELTNSLALGAFVGEPKAMVKQLKNKNVGKDQIKALILPDLIKYFQGLGVNINDFDFTIANDKITISLKSA